MGITPSPKPLEECVEFDIVLELCSGALPREVVVVPLLKIPSGILEVLLVAQKKPMESNAANFSGVMLDFLPSLISLA